MTCSDFMRRLDEYIHGRLDWVEWREFVTHRRQCATCARELARRNADYLWQYGSLVGKAPQPCLKPETIRRWLTAHLPAELSPMVTAHLDECPDCEELSLRVAEEVELPGDMSRQ